MGARRRCLLGGRVDLTHLLQPLHALLLHYLRKLLGLFGFSVAFDLVAQCGELGRELRRVRVVAAPLYPGSPAETRRQAAGKSGESALRSRLAGVRPACAGASGRAPFSGAAHCSAGFARGTVTPAARRSGRRLGRALAWLATADPWWVSPGRLRAGYVGVGHRGQLVQDRADPKPLLGAVPERAVRVHGVAGAPPDPGAREVALSL